MPPIELTFDAWEVVIDILGDESDRDIASLRALCLTCKVMVHPCRKHLFSKVALTNYEDDIFTRTDGFLKLISHSPAMIQYVRYFEHNICYPDDVRVHQILEILAGSESRLRVVSLGSSAMGWNTFPMPFQIALERLLHLPSVNDLRLSFITAIPSTVFSGCTHIQSLSLYAVDFSIPDLVPCPITTYKPHYLSVEDGCFAGLRSIMKQRGENGDVGIIDFSCLDQIDLSISSPDGMGLLFEVLEVSTVIQELDLGTYGYIPLAGLGAALSTWSVRTLKRLLFRFVVKSEDYDPLCGLVSDLSVIAGTNIIEEIILCVFFNTDVECRAGTSDWSSFDALVTSATSFPRLKTVTVDISWLIFGADEEEALNRITENDFPNLSESETLEFRYTVTIQDD